jgi:hypothetical protein
MRLLAFVVSCLAGVVYYLWAVSPLYTLGPYPRARCFHVDRAMEQATVFLKRSGDWYFVTLNASTGEMVKEVRADVSSDNATVYWHRSTNTPMDTVLATVYLGRQLDQTIVIDPETGKCLTPTPLPTYIRAYPAMHGNRVVLPMTQSILLIEKGRTEQRHIPMVMASVCFLPDGQHLLVREDRRISIVDWESGRILASSPLSGDPFRIILFALSPQEFVLGTYLPEPKRYLRLDRWRWNGGCELLQLDSLTMDALTQKDAPILGGDFERNTQEQMVLDTYATICWPRSIQPLLSWLESKGWPVEKHWPKETMKVKAVIDKDFRLLRKYAESLNPIIPTGNGIGVQLKTDRTGNTGTLVIGYRIAAQWPNALAIAMACYLMGYVYRHRQCGKTK